jgi:hypothetical protein
MRLPKRPGPRCCGRKVAINLDQLAAGVARHREIRDDDTDLAGIVLKKV